MDINLARNITRKFILENQEIKAVLAGDWEFIKEENRIYIYSEIQNIRHYLCSSITYMNDYIFNGFDIYQNKLKGNFYFTSVGLVSESDFYIAEDFLEENNTRIGKDELEVGNIYMSNKGIRYAYLGEIEGITIGHKKLGGIYKRDENFLEKKSYKTVPLIYKLKNGKITKLSSVKLIKNEGELQSYKKLEISSYGINPFVGMINIEGTMESYYKLSNEDTNISIKKVSQGNLNCALSIYYGNEENKVDDFIESEEKLFDLRTLEIKDSQKSEKERLAKFKEKKFLVGNTGKIYKSMYEFEDAYFREINEDDIPF